MDKGLYNIVVGETKFYKFVWDLMVGGDTSAHIMSYKCRELLDEGKTYYFEELISESYHKGSAWDAVKLIAQHYFNRVPDTEKWPPEIRQFVHDRITGERERPKRARKKGQQGTEITTDVGVYEEGRDWAVGWLMNHYSENGYQLARSDVNVPRSTADTIGKEFNMCYENVLRAYYKFKYSDKNDPQLPDPFTFNFNFKIKY